MIDTTLIDKLKILADKERKIKEFKKRLRVKGRVTAKGTTKNGNKTITIKTSEDDFRFTVLRSHKESFALADNLKIGNAVSIAGIPKFRMIICTKLKLLNKGIDEGKQIKISSFT